MPLHRKALEIFLAVYGDRHRRTALSYNNVAACLQDQGKHAEALPLYQKALEAFRSILGEGHTDTAVCYDNAAGCLIALGRYGQPHEIAGVVAFLAGPDAAFVTGAEIVADGGFTA